MNTAAESARGLSVSLSDGTTIAIDALTPAIVRIRKYRGSAPESPLIRYGFVRDDWPPAPREVSLSGAIGLSTGELTITVDPERGTLALRDEGGRELLVERDPAVVDQGFRTCFHLPPELRFFGLGDQARDRLEHRGTRPDLWVRNVQTYIPIPLLLTTGGYALLVNTTRRLRFDLGAEHDDRFGFAADGGSLDLYVLRGDSLKQQLMQYTQLTGRPPLPPRWAFGLFFICRTQADAREFMDDCYTFRREGIPCDAIGLEPGWMAHNYDYSVTKDWHPERFPVPPYARYGRHNFLPAARRMGFKPGLWLCSDYDLSWEEERRLAAARAADAEEGASAAGHEVDEHLLGARRMDTITRPDEPWYRHLEDFVEQGVEWFKQDGSNQVLSHPDRLYGNGMTDAEMHNLNPLLYAKQMYLGFREKTGRRPFVFTVAGWAGLQRYANTWTGDTGGEEGPLAACLNLSLSGHGMTTPDMEVTSPEGIHFGFLLGWAQLNSWNYWRHPWLQGEFLTGVFRAYAELRYRLIPYLYSCAWEAHTTGLPLLRAMPLEYPEDRETHHLLHQYLLGPALLVGAFTRRVYLPAGEWTNVWTGERHAGPGWCEPTVPADRGGPLLAKAGAIVPMGPRMQYVGQVPDDELTIHVWPGPAGEFVLYEDDGSSFGYEAGEGRTTRLRQEAADGLMRLTMEPAEGSFAGAIERRQVTVVAHLAGPPNSGSSHGVPVAGEWDGRQGVWTVALGERPASEPLSIELALPSGA